RTLTPSDDGNTQATATSALPSWLKSPVVTPLAQNPVAKLAVGPNVPPPVFRLTFRCPNPPLTVAMSGNPSPLKSATATAVGLVPTGTVWAAAANPPAPLPSIKVTVLAPLSATAKSRCPSPSKSATSRATGPVLAPTVYVAAAWKVP